MTKSYCTLAIGLQERSYPSLRTEECTVSRVCRTDRRSRLLGCTELTVSESCRTRTGENSMWWQKKSQSRVPEWVFKSTPPATSSIPSTIRQIENSQLEDAKKMPTESTALNQSRLGPSVVLKGELEGKDDLVIEGQFEGTINLQDRCLT